MARTLETLPIPTGERILDLLPRLRWALAGNGPALLPVPEDDDTEAARLATSLAAGAGLAAVEDDPDDPTVLVLATSGSTGASKGALLPASALAASAEATRRRLSCIGPRAGTGHSAGAGNWLLTLPAHHIAGMQVLLRSIALGTEPVVMDTRPRFSTETFTAAVGRMAPGPRFTSLVPTQLHRILADPDATTALTTFAAVLLGGAATPQALLDDAEQAGARVVTTYGMSETCGGCVYDGIPLAGVQVAIDRERDPSRRTGGSTTGGPGDSGGPGGPRRHPAGAHRGASDPPRPARAGRVSITGPVVARGYRDLPGHPAFVRNPATGDRTFLTSDLAVTAAGRMRIVGRVDEVIVTGGIKVDPALVESVLMRVTGVADIIVTGVPDPEWGTAVVAVVRAGPGRPPDLDALRRAATYAHGPAAAPRYLVLVADLPRRGPGKPDRTAVRNLAVSELAGRLAGRKWP